MEIKVGLNGAYYKLVIDQKELNEIACGLGWSSSEGCAIDDTLNNKLQDQLKEFVTE